jgi:hypothetical protein
MHEQFKTCTDSIACGKGIIYAMGDKCHGRQMNTHSACSKHPNLKLAYCWDIQTVRFKRLEEWRNSQRLAEVRGRYKCQKVRITGRIAI